MSNSVMRVWALASCSGLLALTACSNERSGPPQVDSPSPLDDDSAQIDAQAERVASLPRPAVNPETLNSRPLFPSATRSPNPARFPSATTVAGRQSVSSSAEQLRARVQQIRAQRARALPASGTPASSNRSPRPVTTLSPFAVGAQNPLPGGGNSTPTAAGSGTELNRNVLPTSQQVVTALPTPAQPTLAPGVAPNTRSLNPGSPSAANPINSSPAATSPAATALAGNNVITASPHLNHSARSGQALALTPLSSSGIGSHANVNLGSAPSVPPRTHQSTARTPGTSEDTNAASAQPLFPIAETPDTEADAAANDTTGADTAASEPETAPDRALNTTPGPEAAVTPPSPGSSGHISTVRPTLTAIPQPSESTFNLQPGAPRFSNRTPTQHISGVTSRPAPQPEAAAPAATPNSLAESLPLYPLPSAQRLPRIQVRPEHTPPRLTVDPQPSDSRATSPEVVPLAPGFSTVTPNSDSTAPEAERPSPSEPGTAEPNRPEIQPMTNRGHSPKALTLSYCSRPDLLTSLLANPAAHRSDSEASLLKAKVKTFLSGPLEEATQQDRDLLCLPGAKPQPQGQLHGLKQPQAAGSWLTDNETDTSS